MDSTRGEYPEMTEAGSAEFVTPSETAEYEIAIVDDPATQEYRALVGERSVGSIHYTREPGEPTVLVSTYVDPELRGRGIATAFIAHVMDERLEQGERVVVTCPLILEFLQNHREYDDIVMGGA